MEWVTLILAIAIIFWYKHNQNKQKAHEKEVEERIKRSSFYKKQTPSEQSMPSHITVEHLAPEDRKAKKGHKGVHCPKCRSLNCEFLVKDRKGFSVKKAVVGGVMTGGIGTMAGFAGGKGKKGTFQCKNCGNVFQYKM